MFTSDYFAPVLRIAISVRLAARSFIIPVPAAIGQDLVYPFDIKGQPALKKGTPILDSQGQPKGTGIVFINHTDGAVQSVRDDGKGMIIANGLSVDQAEMLFSYYNQIIPVPEKTTGPDIIEILRYAYDELGIDDFFNGNRSKIPNFDIEKQHRVCKECGIFIRRSDEKRFALLGIGSGTYSGPASSPQRFRDNVILVSNAKHSWLVQTNAFQVTYRHPDNRDIKLEDLPAVVMQEGQAPTPTLSLK